MTISSRLGRALSKLAAALIVALAAASTAKSEVQGSAAQQRYLDPVFAEVKKTEDIVYGAAPNADGHVVPLRLDLYEPAGDAAPARPAVIWVHGGGFKNGSNNNTKVVDLSMAFARRGYIAVGINYRLLGGACSPEQPDFELCRGAAAYAGKHDAQAAVRWLRSQAGRRRIDAERIAIGGSSAGSVAALLVGTQPENAGSSGNPGYPSEVGAVVANCGGLTANGTIDSGDPPTIFFVGTKDGQFDNMLKNHQGMREQGIATEFLGFEDRGHCPWEQPYRSLITTNSARFLYEHLRLGPQPEPPPPVPPASACGARISGTPLRDVLRGTRKTDRITSGAGNDLLYGLSGSDCLYPGEGVDRVTAGPGGDRVLARAGHDRVDSGPGSDRVFGHAGGDRLVGGHGADRLYGGLGRDRLLGGAGSDLIGARDGRRDVIDCGRGRDRVRLDGRDVSRRCELRRGSRAVADPSAKPDERIRG